jgi:HPt (histidine-containing phosphotransfer) domain-containing protein
VLAKWMPSGPEFTGAANQRQTLRPSADPATLDVEGALSRLGGRKHLYLKVAQKFVPEFGDSFERIRHKMADGDMTSAMRSAHSLKGAAAGIGAMTLSKAAADLEKALSGQEADVEPLLESFKNELDIAIESIGVYLDKELKSKQDIPVSLEAENTADRTIDSTLSRLFEYLDAGDMRAVNTWAQVKRFFQNNVKDSRVADIDQKIDCFDFDDALKLLKILKKKFDWGDPADDRSKQHQG